MKKIVLAILMFANQQLIAQDKCVSGNCITGTGKMVYTDGRIYEGGFVNGSKQGTGKMEAPYFVYTGEWRGGLYNGQGKLKKRASATSEFYEEYNGTFVNGINNGEGQYIYYIGKDSNIVYRGNFKDGHYFGKGNLTVKPFSIDYSDSWIDNKTFTHGTEVRLDSKEIYEGHYAELNFEREKRLSPGSPVRSEKSNVQKSFKQLNYYTGDGGSSMLDYGVFNTSKPRALTGVININVLDSTIIILDKGTVKDKLKIKTIEAETTNPDGSKTLIISAVDVQYNFALTATIVRDQSNTAKNEMRFIIKYTKDGSGHEYACTYLENLFNY